MRSEPQARTELGVLFVVRSHLLIIVAALSSRANEARRIAANVEAAKLVDNATLSAPCGSTSIIIPCGQLWGAHGRVVGNLIRAGTSRLAGIARDNDPVCSVATGEPPTVSEIHGR